MCVRALRITVLKSAGNFTRDECHHLNAENVQRVKCFMVTGYGICCVLEIFESSVAPAGLENFKLSSVAAEAGVTFGSGLPGKHTTNRLGATSKSASLSPIYRRDFRWHYVF